MNGKSSSAGLQIESFTSYYDQTQVTNEPTRHLSSSLSCIELIITSQPNLVPHFPIYSSVNTPSPLPLNPPSFNFETYVSRPTSY